MIRIRDQIYPPALNWNTRQNILYDLDIENKGSEGYDDPSLLPRSSFQATVQGLQTQIELGSLTVRRQKSEFRETSVLRHQGRVSDAGNCTGEKKKFFRGPSFTLWLNSDLPICIRKLPAAGEKNTRKRKAQQFLELLQSWKGVHLSS